MRVLAIDPGNTQSAWIGLDNGRPMQFGITRNEEVLQFLPFVKLPDTFGATEHLAIETMKPRGMPTSFEEMQTQFWAGRFVEQAKLPFTQCFRHDIKMHHCGRSTASDSNIRAALIDRFGGESKAIGGKRCKACSGKGWRGRNHDVCDRCNGTQVETPRGPLHGVHDDVWSALAVGLYFFDTHVAPAARGSEA